MYIRWKYYLRKDRSRTIRAEVVRSFRDCVKDEPRNRTVCYLGSIRECDLSDAAALLSFWQTVDRKLSMLLIPVSQEMRLKSKLAKRIPRPAGSPAMYTSLWKENMHQLASSVRHQETEDVDAESPSLTELGQWLTELLRRVG
jgi:hypothetical protein